MRNLQEQVKKSFCYKKLFKPCNVSINVQVISGILQILVLQPQISKVFFWSLEAIFSHSNQNNFDAEIHFFAYQ